MVVSWSQVFHESQCSFHYSVSSDIRRADLRVSLVSLINSTYFSTLLKRTPESKYFLVSHVSLNDSTSLDFKEHT